MNLRVCLEPGCPTLTRSRRCPRHERTSTRNHRGIPRQQRGYDVGYERTRRALAG